MADTGPTRSDRDRLKGHRAEKPYDRVQPRPSLRRSASIVDSLKSLVTIPFSWLASGSAGPNTQPTNSPDSNPVSSLRPSNGNVKRKPSSPDASGPELAPKKRRRESPNAILAVDQPTATTLKSSISVPLLSTQSAALRPGRATFLPPLPRPSTPSRQSSIEPARFASPALRASPSVGSTVFARRAASITPQSSLDEGADRTAFGLRYRSPFMPRASPAPPTNPMGAHAPSPPRQSSIFSERGKPRAASSLDAERVDSVSPARPNFSPAASPLRRLSDSVNSQLVPPFQSTALGRTDLHSQQQRRGSTSRDVNLPLSQAQRAVSYVAARSASPEKMSVDRVFQALEEALPWSQSRKLRHEQRAKIKVPVPATASKLAGRAGRMVKPYGRSHQHKTAELTNFDSVERPKTSDRLLESLVEKRDGVHNATSHGADGTVSKTEKTAPTTSANPSPSLLHRESRPSIPPESSPTASTFLPPPHSIGEDQEPAEPLPFALVPDNAVSANIADSNSSSQAPSSLRERRTRTSAVHASSVPRRPPGNDKRPNRFALDDGDGGRDGESLDPEEIELEQWASRSGIALEVPTGWSFGPPPVTANNVAAVTSRKNGDGAERAVNITPSTAQSNPTPSITLPPTLATDSSHAGLSALKTFSPSSTPSFTHGFGPQEGNSPGIKKEVMPSIVPPLAVNATSATSLFAGFGGMPATEMPTTGSTKSTVFSASSLLTVPTPASGNGPSPFGNVATKSTPFGTPGMFRNAGALGPQFAEHSGKPGVVHKGNEDIHVKARRFPFTGFGDTPSEGAGAEKLSLFGNIPKPLPSTVSESDSRQTEANPTTSANETPEGSSTNHLGPPAGASATHSSTSKFSSAGGAVDGGHPEPQPATPCSDTPLAPTLECENPLPAVTLPQSVIVLQESEPAKPFTWPGAVTGAAPQNADSSVDAKQSHLNLMSHGSPSSVSPSGPSPATVPPPIQTTLAFGTSVDGAVTAPPPNPELPRAIPQPPFAAVPVGGEPFKFGLNAQQNNANRLSLVGSDDPKTRHSNPPRGPSVFSFGNPPAPASADKAATMPPSPFSSSPNTTPGPALSFAPSSTPNPSSNSPSRINAPQDARPTTPPTTNNENMMETSPVQSVATPQPITNGNGPFTFGAHASAPAASAFTFGSTQPGSSTFGDSSSQRTPFTLSSSRPGTPSKSFGDPTVSTPFGSSGAPASPFGAAQQLPAPAFTFGSSSSQPQPSTPSAPQAFSFTFSPVASPTLSPTTVGGSGTNAPFVFGAGTEGSSQTPATPTTPNRRPLRGLPQRKKR